MGNKAVAVTKGAGSVVRWEEQLARDSQIAVAAEQGVGVGSFIQTRGGRMQFAGQPVKDNKLRCVVVDHLAVNAYYATKFNPNEPASPICYAFGHVQADGTMPVMAPHERAQDKQSPTCGECRWNAFKTDDRGKGKACKNIRRLALVHADTLVSLDALKKTQLTYINVPVTSVGGWANYVRSLGAVSKRPPYAVVTEIEQVADDKVQWRLLFNLVKEIDDKKVLQALHELHVKAEKDIAQPYPENAVAAAKQSKGQRAKVGSKKR